MRQETSLLSSVVCLKMKVSRLCPTLCDPMDYAVLYSPGQNTGVGSLSLLQGISPIQGSNPGFPHCRPILHQLSHKGSPRILKWVAYPFSSRSSRPRNQTRASCIAGRFFTNWATREALCIPENNWVEQQRCLHVSCINIHTAAAAAKSLQSCPTLCDPIDGNPPGSPVPGILQEEHWSGLLFPSPMHESEKRKWSCSVMSDSLRPHGLQPTRLLCP